jgi:hypothetical protein
MATPVWSVVDLWIQDGALAERNVARTSGMGLTVFDMAGTPQGMRQVEAWPRSPAVATDRFLAAVESAAETAADPSLAERLR